MASTRGIGYRCSTCGISWPDHKDFYKCPQCEEETDRMSLLYPISVEEAVKLKRHADFERYYAAREASN